MEYIATTCRTRRVVLVLMLFFATVASAHAQEPPALTVRLRDVVGTGVASAQITVVDLSGTRVLGRATTDSAGVAAFPPLPAADVRVLVSGRLPNGVPLSLPGDDARGMRLILGPPSLMLELRSEVDGTVLPDPATALSLETGAAPDVPLAPFDPATIPLAPPAPVAVDPLATAPSIAQVPPTPFAPAPASVPATSLPANTPALWPGWLLLGVLVVTVLVVVLVQFRWRAR